MQIKIVNYYFMDHGLVFYSSMVRFAFDRLSSLAVSIFTSRKCAGIPRAFCHQVKLSEDNLAPRLFH